jgi:MFS family permease
MMMGLMSIHISLFGYLYKNIGLEQGIDDYFLSWAGSFSAMTQGVTRIVIGYLYDKYGFRQLFYILVVSNTVAAFTCYSARYNEWTFFFVIQLSFFASSGMFALFPTAVCNTFGSNHGPRLYSVILLAGSIASVFDTLMMKIFYDIL